MNHRHRTHALRVRTQTPLPAGQALLGLLGASQRILISGNEAGKPRRLYILDLATNKLETLGHDGLMLYGSQHVSRDGTRSVVFREDSTAWLLNLDDRKVRPISLVGDPFGWSAQRTLFLIRGAGAATILEELNPETGAVTQIGSLPLTTAGAAISTLVMTPDKERIVYSAHNATADLYTLRLPE